MDIHIVDVDPVTQAMQKAFRGVLEVFGHEGLLPETRVAYGYLMGKEPGWVVRREDVRRRLGCGDYKMRKVMKELRENGWMAVQVRRLESGQALGRRLIFCPRGDGKDRDGSVYEEEPLALKIGKMLPEPEVQKWRMMRR